MTKLKPGDRFRLKPPTSAGRRQFAWAHNRSFTVHHLGPIRVHGHDDTLELGTLVTFMARFDPPGRSGLICVPLDWCEPIPRGKP